MTANICFLSSASKHLSANESKMSQFSTGGTRAATGNAILIKQKMHRCTSLGSFCSSRAPRGAKHIIKHVRFEPPFKKCCRTTLFLGVDAPRAQIRYKTSGLGEQEAPPPQWGTHFGFLVPQIRAGTGWPHNLLENEAFETNERRQLRRHNSQLAGPPLSQAAPCAPTRQGKDDGSLRAKLHQHIIVVDPSQE